MTILNKCFALLGLPAVLAAGAACNRTSSETTVAPYQAAEQSSIELVNAKEAERLIAAKQVAILDVRTPAEFRAGHIAGATNLNFQDAAFEAELQKLDKTQPYLVHCAVGGRSARARATMKRLGFESVYDLAGGIRAWEQAQQEVVK